MYKQIQEKSKSKIIMNLNLPELSYDNYLSISPTPDILRSNSNKKKNFQDIDYQISFEKEEKQIQKKIKELKEAKT